MNTGVVMPDFPWYCARLGTAPPSPPVRANGASSAARCTTGAGEPAGRTSGAAGALADVRSPLVLRRTRLVRRGASGRGGALPVCSASEGDTPSPTGEAQPPTKEEGG